jgi:hypothetical protein
MHIRSLVAALVAAAAFGTVGVPVASASNGTTVPPKAATFPPLMTVHLHGIAKNGKTFRGSYGIQRYVVSHGVVYADGTLKGTLKHRHVTRQNVMIPVRLTGAGSTASSAQATCPILHLVLGPIKLNLLGLRVTLGGGAQANQPIVLDITAVPGPGNLLCDLTNALNQNGVLSALQSDLQNLAATLTSLSSLFGRLP